MPSPKILEQKKGLVEQLAAELKEAESIVFADYQGLTVAQDTQMRKDFRENGVTYRVIKNNISRRALESLGIDNIGDELTGPTALAFSTEDVVMAPRLVKKYVDEFKKTIEIKGGVVHGKLESLDLINQLSNIPSQETLYGQLVTSILFPITSLAMTLGAAVKEAEEKGFETAQQLADATAGNKPAEEEAPAEEAEEAKAEEPAAEAPAEAAEEAKAEEPAEAEEAEAAEAKEDAPAEEAEAPAEEA